jgi:hypothetical protein
MEVRVTVPSSPEVSCACVRPRYERRGDQPSASRPGQVEDGQEHRCGRADDLVQHAVVLGERGAQRLVPLDRRFARAFSSRARSGDRAGGPE